MFWFLNIRAQLMKQEFYLGTIFHTLLWGLIVPIFSSLFIKISEKLNNWENWRTELDHQKYYTAKVCSLLLINLNTPRIT